MQKVKEIGAGVIMALCELLVGVLLLIDPLGFTSGIIMVIGIILVITGVFNIIGYFRSTPQAGVIERKLSAGILSVAGGVFCAVNPQWFAATFPVLTLVYGLGILVMGVYKIEAAANMVRLKMKHWIWAALGSALTLVCAVIIICNPLSSTTALWLFIAITLIIEAIIDFVAAFFPSREG